MARALFHRPAGRSVHRKITCGLSPSGRLIRERAAPFTHPVQGDRGPHYFAVLCALLVASCVSVRATESGFPFPQARADFADPIQPLVPTALMATLNRASRGLKT